MILLELFWAFFQIGLFSFGGGMAALPLIQNQVVDQYGWLTMKEYTDLLTISQMTPGPIAINASTFGGTQVAGVVGSIVATLGCIMPSCIIISLLAWLYARYKNLDIMKGILTGLRPAVVGLIASAGMTIIAMAFWGEAGLSNLWNVDTIAIAIFVVAVLILQKFKVDPILIMIVCGIIGGFIYL